MRKYKPDKKLLILIFLNLLLFLPSLFEPISYGDECIYLTLGNAFRKGLIFYRDIHDNKPPLLYFLAAITSGRLFWLRIFAITANLIHLTIIYELVGHLTKNKFAPLVSGIVFTIAYLVFEGRIANGEIFMMLPTTLAVYLIFKNQKKKKLSFGIFIGFLFSIGFLFKIPVAFDLAGIIIALCFLSPERPGIKFILGIILGFVTPILTSIGYYTGKDAFTPYVRSALMQNIGYLSSWQGSNSGLIIRFIVIGLITIAIIFFKNKVHFKNVFFLIWFLFSFFGATLSGRPYPHYLIEIVPSLAVIAALFIDQKNKRNFLFILLPIFFLIYGYFHLKFWYYPILPYYKNFLKFASGKIDKDQYLSFWGKRTENDYKIAKLVTEIGDDERAFFWGDGACIYAISGKLPPGRYTVNYHILDFDGFVETLSALEKYKPKIIVKLAEEKKSWPELDQFLTKYYHRFYYPGVSDKIYSKDSKW